MQTVDAMDITNFSFKDIGVYHNDEKIVRKALSDYYSSGRMTSFGRNLSFKEVDIHSTIGTGLGDTHHVSLQKADLEKAVYRGIKPKLGKHHNKQKIHPEEIELARIKAQNEANRTFFA